MVVALHRCNSRGPRAVRRWLTIPATALACAPQRRSAVGVICHRSIHPGREGSVRREISAEPTKRPVGGLRGPWAAGRGRPQPIVRRVSRYWTRQAISLLWARDYVTPWSVITTHVKIEGVLPGRYGAGDVRSARDRQICAKASWAASWPSCRPAARCAAAGADQGNGSPRLRLQSSSTVRLAIRQPLA